MLQRLDIPAGRKAANMSGGTRTKLALALAFAPRPPLLLLDEPTTGLDPVARREFNDQLVELQRQQGTTVMFLSHLVGEVEQVAQRVGIIQAGSARFEGPISQLCAELRRVRGLDAQLEQPGFTQAWLGLAPLSATSLAADAWLQPHQFSRAAGSPGHLVLRAALGHPDLSAGDLEAAVRAEHIGD